LGKPYWSELTHLPATYKWANQVDVSRFERGVRDGSLLPLVAIGSGGSFSAAVHAAWCHQRSTGQLGLAVTPLQAADLPNLRSTSALILSAGGSNPDVLGVCRRMIQQEPEFLNVLCLSENSPLARLCAEYEFVRCAEAPLQLRDGFVATNSILALATIISRSYSQLPRTGIPESLEELLQASNGLDQWVEALRETCLPAMRRPYLLVLHGGAASMPAAFDLESKCSEAALAAVQVSDYRNFAHGRHHWLAKKGAETGVIAFMTEDDSRLPERTLALLPDEVAVAPIRIASKGDNAALEALVASLYVAGFIGDAHQIDPGRPGVPEFGRRIYHLNAWSKKATAATTLRKTAIERKVGLPMGLLPREEADQWTQAYDSFVEKLESTTFEALVLDYDGTVCDDKFRYTTLPSNIAGPLESLLRAGAQIGFATGRGKSVRRALRDCIGSTWWRQVIIAYHNGAEIATLDADDIPPAAFPHAALIQTVGERLAASSALRHISQLDCKPYQVTVISTSPAYTERVYNLVCDLTADTFAHGITCLRSAHSVDLLAPGITKVRLLDHLASAAVSPAPAFLCIGDLGGWPGNDFALLGTPYSLSAHHVSSAPDRCWNLVPAGLRNSQATRWYLERTEPSGSMLTFRLSRSGT
jgi:hypothetical protein